MDLNALCEELGVKFYDACLLSENGKKIYRVSITKKGGVSLDDCQKVSEVLSPMLDINAPTKDEYFLEVSSPGLERILKTLQHFSLSIGEMVKITTDDKEQFEGEIISVKDENIIIKNEEKEFKLLFSSIKKAKTFVLW
ncbi:MULTISPECIES: ribosome maturation factor RimP [unclassified Campylobacter]|uniref:ribosome maturation factor RimP n=1 Tax=unclassified Campylobacter TaxID=2593542 RepID=UPI0012382B04|nr:MULTISPECIES: ribosome maturation factor RimP [unclassified Campylobacter]KAA6226274.1 ribosome maturation factor RimP [Campylobacter sp. LR196d]KAA6226705.1 ribosome maturation factor RimP [Campylobacter sp. LR286c]KAA6227737.1 ribosome maturation factor RimP [Campylobacter sp. LR185c]KAA6231269.1 ribosome maturation factor RimP [Campylobacter sp. LR291e]KAA6234158.1 ribosome maturation factor RimP [Campylobacter sp. LR264d]